MTLPHSDHSMHRLHLRFRLYILAMNLILWYYLLSQFPVTVGAARGKGSLSPGGKAAAGGQGSSGSGSVGGMNGGIGQFGSCGDMDCENMGPISGEREVKRMLLCGYDRTSRPVRNDSTTTVVHVAVALFHILDTDEKHQTFSVLVSVRLRWYDEYLVWEPDEYNGTKSLHIPASIIWTPDIVIANNADDAMKGYMSTYAIVESTGYVLWMFPSLMKVTCTLDVRHFPFDRQHCDLTFISWTYNGFEVDVTHNTTLDDNKVYYNHNNQEWTVTNISTQRNVKIYACCEEPYPDVTITIHIKRRSLFYIFNLIFPCLLMYMASFLGFFLPTESGEKVNLELTILLALVVFLLIIGESLPPTPDAIPLLGVLFGITMVMVLLALLMGVIVTNIHVRKYTSTGIPRILQRYLRQVYCKYHTTRDKNNSNFNPKLSCSPTSPNKLHGGHTFICCCCGASPDKIFSTESQEANYYGYTINEITKLHPPCDASRFISVIRDSMNTNNSIRCATVLGNVEATGVDGAGIELSGRERNDCFANATASLGSPDTEENNRSVESSFEQINSPIVYNRVLASTLPSAPLRNNCNGHVAKDRGLDHPDSVLTTPQKFRYHRVPSHLSLHDYDESPYKSSKRSALIVDGDIPVNPSKPVVSKLSTSLDSVGASDKPASDGDTCICNNPESWVFIARSVDRMFFWLFLMFSVVVLGLVFYQVPFGDSF